MPLPLNHMTKRLSIAVSALTAVPAAYAVPVALNIETSGGRPTQICAPERENPFNNALRDSLVRSVITCDMIGGSFKRPRAQKNRKIGDRQPFSRRTVAYFQ